MTESDVVDRVQRMRLRRRDLLVLRFAAGADDEEVRRSMQELKATLRRLHPDVDIVGITGDISIRQLDDQRMKALGWVRDRK